MRLTIACLVGLLVAMHVAHADPCDNLKTPAQVLGGLSSDDQVAKLVAKTCGLASADPSVRSLVLQQLIEGLSTMSFDVEALPQDTVGAQLINQMPQFIATSVKWSDDGRSFSGYFNGAGNSAVLGQLLGESLGITFEPVIIQPSSSGGQATRTVCSATLTLPQNGTQIQGTLRCTGVATRFSIALGI